MACCRVRAKMGLYRRGPVQFLPDLMSMELHLFNLDGQIKFVSKSCRQKYNNVKIQSNGIHRVKMDSASGIWVCAWVCFGRIVLFFHYHYHSALLIQSGQYFFNIHSMDQCFMMSWKSCGQNIFFSKCIYNYVSVTFLMFLTVHTGNSSSYNNLIRNPFSPHDRGQVTGLMRATWCH